MPLGRLRGLDSWLRVPVVKVGSWVSDSSCLPKPLNPKRQLQFGLAYTSPLETGDGIQEEETTNQSLGCELTEGRVLGFRVLRPKP